MFGRNGGRVDYQAGFLTFTGKRYLFDILFIVDEHTFFFQSAGQFRRNLVVTSHYNATVDEIAGNGTHSYATSPNKVHCFYIFYVHCSIYFLQV